MPQANLDRVETPLQKGGTIRSISSTIVDIPTIREHKLSKLAVTAQSYVIVRLLTEDGVEGIGEAATLGGPKWGEESVETIKAIIDTYLTPALIGHPIEQVRSAVQSMHAAAKRNYAAKAAVETAVLDALGKTQGLPVHAYLGGAVRDHVPVLWALASGDPAQETEEALGMVEAGRHKDFKIKIGAQDPDADIKRLQKVAAGINPKGRLYVVDANQAWDEATSHRLMPAMGEMGIGLLEQPVPHWNVDAMARLSQRSLPPLLADESVYTAQDAVRVGAAGAAAAVSLKLVKHGGPLSMMDVAAASVGAGLGLYGGCLLESTIGTAAQLHVYAALPELAWGSESFGPLILKDDIVQEPLSYQKCGAYVPTGSGLGVTLDLDKFAHYSRDI